jgi:hypothetical protein
MTSTPSAKQEKLTLTDRLRVITAGFIDPVVTFLAKIKITPDFLTILGMLAHGLFAWLIIEGPFAGMWLCWVTWSFPLNMQAC